MRTAVFSALSPYKKTILGASLGAIVLGFWGLVIGAGVGLAIEMWERFLSSLQQARQPAAAPLVAPEINLALAVASFARALDLPGLADARKAPFVLKRFFAIDANGIRYVAKLLQQQSEASADSEQALQLLVNLCQKNASHGRAVVQCLLELARDTLGGIDQTSRKAIENLAQKIGLAEHWPNLSATYRFLQQDDEPYDVLGVTPAVSLEAVTRIYRELMQKTHPDRWAHVPNLYTRARLQERAARINAAYERIRKIRA